MNPFAYMREWFIWATQQFVTYSIWCYAQYGPIVWLGELFRLLSDWTSAIAGELYTLASWYDYVTGRVAELLTWDNILSYLGTYLDAAINAWNWVSNAWNNVWGIADSWWSSTQYTVKAWIAAATQGFDALKAAWSNFWNVTWPVWTGKLDYLTAAWNNFWSVTFPTLVSFSWLTTWWTARVKDVQGLIDSAFIVREGFWTGWQDWRDKVTEFFTDPEEWLYKSLDRIIERFW